MHLKGFENLVNRIPELDTTGGSVKIAAYFFGIFTLTTVYFILTDRIPTWTLDSQIVVISLGYLILSRFFTQKKKYIKRYGDDAYRQAFGRFALPGLAVVFASAAHTAYMNGPIFSGSTLLTILTWLGWTCIIIGIPLCIRAVQVLGVDNVTMLYVYFPGGGMVNSEIYNILRHPLYGGALRITIGLACLNQGIYALTFVLLLPLGVFGWLRLVEERDLIERFPGYVEYRNRTPAFFPYPNRIIDFFKFLLTGK